MKRRLATRKGILLPILLALALQAGCGGDAEVSVVEEDNSPDVAGVVLLPDSVVASIGGGFFARLADAVIRRAEALTGVSAAGGVFVQVSRLTQGDIVQGQALGGPPINNGVADGAGRYQISLGADIIDDCEGGRVLVYVTNGGQATRAIAFSDEEDINVSATSEAMVRLISDLVILEGVDYCAASNASLRDVYTAIDGATTFTTGATVPEINANATEAAASDPAVIEALAAAFGIGPPTRTPTATNTPSVAATDTPTVGPSPTNTAIPTATDTVVIPTSTFTATPVDTDTPTEVPTSTDTPTVTPTPLPDFTGSYVSVLALADEQTAEVAFSVDAEGNATGTVTIRGADNEVIEVIDVSGTANLETGEFSLSGEGVDLSGTLPAGETGGTISGTIQEQEVSGEVDRVLPTPTPTETATAEPTPTETATAEATPTETEVPTATNTPVDTATPVNTATNTATLAPTSTNTATPPPTATAEPAARLDLSSGSGAPGGQVTLSVTLSGSDNTIAATQNDIFFDPTKVSITNQNCVRDPRLADPSIDKTLLVSVNTGTPLRRLRVGVINILNANIIPDGPLFTCTFTIAAGATPGEMTLLDNMPSASSPSAMSVPVAGTDGIITVTGAGDTPTATAVPATNTPTVVVPPTNTATVVVPPTNTATVVVPPTNTATVPPTATAVPPTNTATVPPTATAVPPTNTATAVPPTETPTIGAPNTPTNTAVPPTPTATMGAQGATLNLTGGSGSPGGQVVVSVALANSMDLIAATQNDIFFDPTKLSITNQNCVRNPRLADPSIDKTLLVSVNSANPRRLRVGVINILNANIITDGPLFQCTFTINAAATAGEMLLLDNNPSASSPAAMAVPVTGTDGTISVQ